MKTNSLSQRKKQKGATILQFLIGTVVGAIALVASINAIQGQRADANLNEAMAFVTTELSTAVSSYYYSNSRTYAGLTAGTALGVANAACAPDNGTLNLIRRYNLRTELPWGDDCWRISTAGTKNAISVQLSCDNMGRNDADSIARCQNLAQSINRADVGMIGVAGCTAPANGATGAAISLTCTFGEPA